MSLNKQNYSTVIIHSSMTYFSPNANETYNLTFVIFLRSLFSRKKNTCENISFGEAPDHSLKFRYRDKCLNIMIITFLRVE